MAKRQSKHLISGTTHRSVFLAPRARTAPCVLGITEVLFARVRWWGVFLSPVLSSVGVCGCLWPQLPSDSPTTATCRHGTSGLGRLCSMGCFGHLLGNLEKVGFEGGGSFLWTTYCVLSSRSSVHMFLAKVFIFQTSKIIDFQVFQIERSVKPHF